MDVTHFVDAPEYQAPGHDGMHCFRMLGKEAGPAEFGWMGLTIMEPGGTIAPSASPYEKLYLVLEGELVFSGGEVSRTLRRWDACRFAANEEREIRNLSDTQAVIVLAMSNVIPDD